MTIPREPLQAVSSDAEENCCASERELLQKLPRKIAFIVGTLGQGGAERQLFYILQALSRSGVCVRLLSLSQGEFWERPIRELGIPVVWVGRSRSRLLRLLRIIAELRKELPEVVQSQHFYTNLYAAAAGRILRLREIGAVRNDVHSEIADGGSRLGRWSLTLPRFLAANSSAAIRNVAAVGGQTRRCYLLPNVVDTDRFTASVRPPERGVRIVAAGRLVPQKRMDRFLKLLVGLRGRSETPVCGVLVGAGPLQAELERLAKDYALGPDQCEFKGAVPDMAAIFQRADLLVLTSDWEGTPNVVLEAMASGLPVVATNVGGVPEVVQHGRTGFVVDPSDEQAILRHTLDLIADSNLRVGMGVAGRQYIEAHHSLQRLPVFLAGLYQRMPA